MLSLSPGVPPPPLLSPVLTEISSILIRLLPPDTLRMDKRRLPLTLTLKVAVCSEVEELVTVLPACVKLLPPLVEIQSCQVLLPSLPYTAWRMVMVLAPLPLKFMVRLPVLRTRTDCVPLLAS